MRKLALMLRGEGISFKIDTATPTEEAEFYALWRTRGHARAELAHALRTQANEAEQADKVLLEPLPIQLDIRNRDRLRVYISVRATGIYATHFILDESEMG